VKAFLAACLAAIALAAISWVVLSVVQEPAPPASAPPCQAASEMANLVCRLDSAYDNCATAAKIIPTTPRSQVNIAKPTGAAPQRLNRPSPVSYEQVITIVRNRRNLRTGGGD
jgi:hypothetical protein